MTFKINYLETPLLILLAMCLTSTFSFAKKAKIDLWDNWMITGTIIVFGGKENIKQLIAQLKSVKGAQLRGSSSH